MSRVVVCSHCNRSISLGDSAQPGAVYACPKCGASLPPAPGFTLTPASKESQEEDKWRMGGFQIAGLVLLIVGAVMTIIGLTLSISTPTASRLSGDPLYSPDAILTRLCLVIMGTGISLIGAVFLARPIAK